ncbi:MAG: hypothetical protein U9M98_00365 [Patescibacteria group bacterium]|nr:hypothetical protein [Patescibacteria group bacterium]
MTKADLQRVVFGFVIIFLLGIHIVIAMFIPLPERFPILVYAILAILAVICVGLLIIAYAALVRREWGTGCGAVGFYLIIMLLALRQYI